jgi:hypothetical protein
LNIYGFGKGVIVNDGRFDAKSANTYCQFSINTDGEIDGLEAADAGGNLQVRKGAGGGGIGSWEEGRRLGIGS